ncbi:MAG TPA: hypothetical protein VJU61_29015 [Polyangiaceae bacterium]|nr:hypothetical protein [Polyangiaceae bacterium]
MKSRIIASALGLIATSIVGLGCSGESPNDTTEIEPSALREEAPAEAESQVVGKDESTASISASRETLDATAVSHWEVSRHPATDALRVRALDLQGEAVGELALELDGETFAVRMGEGSLRLDAEGKVLADTLPSDGRELFGHFQLDVESTRVEYSANGCFHSMLTATVGSILCASGSAVACAAIPVVYCVGSKQCGSNHCAL